jgi:hypothetical protein
VLPSPTARAEDSFFGGPDRRIDPPVPTKEPGWIIHVGPDTQGLYLLTPGSSRGITSEAAAVIGLKWMCWVLLKWCEAEDEADEARMNGSKCSLRRSNSRLSGAESSYFWSWSGAVCILRLLDACGTTCA